MAYLDVSVRPVESAPGRDRRVQRLKEARKRLASGGRPLRLRVSVKLLGDRGQTYDVEMQYLVTWRTCAALGYVRSAITKALTGLHGVQLVEGDGSEGSAIL